MRDSELGELKWTRGEYLCAAVKIPYFAKGGDLLYAPPDLTRGLKPMMSKVRPKTRGELDRMEQARSLVAQVNAAGSDKDREMLAVLAGMGLKKKADAGADEEDVAAALASMLNPLSDDGADGPEAAAEAEAEEEEPADPWDEGVLFRKGKFKVAFVRRSIAPGKISAGQREAWNAIDARGAAIWDEVMDAIVKDYRIQRPAALKWMKARYGDLPLERVLPDYTSAKDVKRLVRLYQIRVREAGKAKSEVGMHFSCAWTREGVGITVREGRVVEVDRAGEIYFDREGMVIEHPVFGKLVQLSDRWFGKTRCDPFLDFARIAEQQIQFWKDPASHKRLVADLGWDFPHGLFELNILSRNGAEPSKAQARAYAAFRRNESKHCNVIFGAILEYYRKTFDQRRRDWKDAYPEIYVPEARRIEDLQYVTELHHIDVYPEDKDGRVCLGLYVTTKWTTECIGLGIHWQDGKLVELCECSDQEMEQAGMSQSEA